MAEPEHSQLTFEVGGVAPNLTSLRVSGPMPVERELRKGDPIMVVVTGPDGEVLAQVDGHVTAVGFKDKRDKYGVIESTTRMHTVRLGP